MDDFNIKWTSQASEKIIDNISMIDPFNFNAARILVDLLFFQSNLTRYRAENLSLEVLPEIFFRRRI